MLPTNEEASFLNDVWEVCTFLQDGHECEDVKVTVSPADISIRLYCEDLLYEAASLDCPRSLIYDLNVILPRPACWGSVTEYLGDVYDELNTIKLYEQEDEDKESPLENETRDFVILGAMLKDKYGKVSIYQRAKEFWPGYDKDVREDGYIEIVYSRNHP